MWLTACGVLTVVAFARAISFLEDPSKREIGVNDFEAGFNSDLNREESPSTSFDESWINGPPDTALLAAGVQQSPDSLISGTDPTLPISNDRAYRLDTSPLNSGCAGSTSSRSRSKRFQEACPTDPADRGEEENNSICQIALYPIPVCCRGPQFGGYTIVNGCYFCRW